MRRLNAISVIICLSFILQSCGSYIPITEKTDEFSGAKTIRMDGCKLKANYSTAVQITGMLLGANEKSMELNLEYIQEPSGETSLSVIAEVFVEGEAFTIDNGESLLLLIDNSPVKLSTSGQYDSNTGVSTSGGITATFSSKAKFPIEKTVVKQIANSTETKVRLLGFDMNASDADKPSLEGVFNEDHKTAYKEFLLKIQ